VSAYGALEVLRRKRPARRHLASGRGHDGPCVEEVDNGYCRTDAYAVSQLKSAAGRHLETGLLDWFALQPGQHTPLGDVEGFVGRRLH